MSDWTEVEKHDRVLTLRRRVKRNVATLRDFETIDDVMEPSKAIEEMVKDPDTFDRWMDQQVTDISDQIAADLIELFNLGYPLTEPS